MGDKLKAALSNGWGKVIVGSGITATIFMASTLVALGGKLKTVDQVEKDLNCHLQTYTVQKAEEIKQLEIQNATHTAQLAAYEQRLSALESSLKDIHDGQNETLKILRDMRKGK
jgi:hypothetical protein